MHHSQLHFYEKAPLPALALPCLLPLLYRLMIDGTESISGLLSDFSSGILLFSLLMLFRIRPLRAIILFCWFIVQIGALELNAAVGRLPVMEDFSYLTDPVFMASSMNGFHLTAPIYTLLLTVSMIGAVMVPVKTLHLRAAALAMILAVIGLLLHSAPQMNRQQSSVTAKYNPAHWMLADAVHQLQRKETSAPVPAELMQSLQWNNGEGQKIIPAQQPYNILLVTLEGIPGIAFASMREAMNISGEHEDLSAFDQALEGSMRVPSLAVHSHQTIRGLYAIHCGDFSKFTFDMPKAYELLIDKEQGQTCLPAQLANNGWETHYLQGAPLQFMNKDKVMPVMGFQQVHGVEWFNSRTVTDFIWGTVDADFFTGAKEYITDLQQHDRPWFLSLLTVGTHQPFHASEELVKKYGSRKKASMAELDLAVTDFLQWLSQRGVLENTLVIFTSDESHGSSLGDWTSSWGYAAVLSPAESTLPSIKNGEYGLVDIEASVLDYFGLSIPAGVKGRSMFRDYDTGRHMFSYTAGRLRWHDPAQGVLECSSTGDCRFYSDMTLLGIKPAAASDITMNPQEMYGAAAALDHSIVPLSGSRILDFSNHEPRELYEKIRNEWTDNLVGAQYLDFPAGSTVQVDITLKAFGDSESEITTRLVLRQFEKVVEGVEIPDIPVLHNEDETSLSFKFFNEEKRQAFTFHLTAEGKNAKLLVKTFTVSIVQE